MSNKKNIKQKSWLGRMAFATMLAFVVFGFGGGVSADTATTTATSTDPAVNATTTYKVMVMEHLCNQNIQSIADIQTMEASGTPKEAFAKIEYNCPTTALYGNSAPVGSITAPRSTFDFQIQADNSSTTSGVASTTWTTTKTLSADGTYTPSKLCESDLNIDLNMSGVISSSTCLDASYYSIPIMIASTSASSTGSMASTTNNVMLKVIESLLPNGYRFGTVRFTPTSTMPNNDASTLTSLALDTKTINLNPVLDNDDMVMLHVFNFSNATSTGNGTGGGGGLSETDKQYFLGLINGLQTQINQLILQVQQLFNLNGSNGGSSGGGMGTTSPIFQSNARVRVGSMTVVIGDSDDFAGERFGANEQVVMSSNGEVLHTYQTDKEGNFNTGSIYVPRTPGYKTYTFTGQTSGISRSVTLTITPIP